MILAQWSFVKYGNWHGSKELVILGYAIVSFHPSVSANNEKICCEIGKDKIPVCEKTAGLQVATFPI